MCKGSCEVASRCVSLHLLSMNIIGNHERLGNLNIIKLKANKGPSSQSYGFSSSHVQMWELDYKEGWAPKNLCFWTVVLEKTLESPLDSKEIKPINPKGINLEYSLKWLMVKLKLQYFGYLRQRANSLEKTLMLGKIEGKRRRGWQRIRLLGGITNSMEEFEQTPGISEGEGSLVCCSPWGPKELDVT